MQTITSRQNPLVKQIVQLHQAKYRAQHNQFIAEGVRACATLVDAEVTLVNLFCTERTHGQIRSLVDDALVVEVSDHVMEKMSTAASPSGVLGLFATPAAPDPATLGPGLVLAQMSNPGNMGTLIRSAAALNVRSVVTLEGCDPWSPKVVQATAGTIGMVHLFEWSWDECMAYKKQIPLCALVTDGGQHPGTADLATSLLVVGSEAHGIPAAWLKDCDAQVTLPMPGGTESLNAAVAGSIALYLGYTGR